MPQTIARNRKKLIESIFAKATEAREFTLDNNFSGEEVGPPWLLKRYQDTSYAKLTFDSANGVYRVAVHSNCWYELKSPVRP